MDVGSERWAAGLILAALLALTAVVVWVEEAPTRLVLTLIAVSVALWAALSARAWGEGARPPSGKERRRYRRLRSRTDELLAHIRQMNAVAAQAEIGRRPRDQAEEELNEMEQQVHLLVPEIRRVVGRQE